MSYGSYALFHAEKMKRELETLRKKKQHLNDLFNGEKISKPTYDYFSKNLDDEISEKESQQKTFADSLTIKLKEQEENTEKLELYLAEIELKNVASEIDANLYEQESKILTLGIENAKRELNTTRTALFKVFPELSPGGEETKIEKDVEKVEEIEIPSEETVEETSSEEITTEEEAEVFKGSVDEQQSTEVSETAQKEPWAWGRYKLKSSD